MKCIAIKIVRTGNGFKERLHVKAFKNMNDRGYFLCRQTNNTWQAIDIDPQRYPDKSGIYAFAGGKYHNVKNLDASVLAHI